jgi:hypothetical protein
MPSTDARGQPGIGHNSKKAAMADDKTKPWHTPAKQTFDEAASANSGPNRHLYQLNWLISIIFDPRLGETPVVVKFLAAAVRYNNRETGTAFPGLKVLAEDIYRDMMQLPPKEAEAIMKNVASLARACGYLLSKRQAPPGGNRAVGHYTFTLPDPDERQQAIAVYQEWLAEENVKKAARKAAKASGAEVTGGVTTAEATARVTSEAAEVTHPVTSDGAVVTRTGGCGNSHRGAEVTRTGNHSLYKNLSLNLPEPAGADAPRGAGEEKGFSGGAHDGGDTPPEGSTPADRATAANQSSPETKSRRAAPRRATEGQFARFWAPYPIKEAKAKAKRNFMALSHDDAEWAIAGSSAYAAQIRAKQAKDPDTRIKWAQGWLTDRRFEDFPNLRPGAMPADAPQSTGLQPGWWRGSSNLHRSIGADTWRLLLKHHASNGAWDEDMLGPPPDSAGCIIPVDFHHDLSDFLKTKGPR